MKQPMIPPVPPAALALFLDVDGTLIDIAAEPDAVDVPSAIVTDLDRLNELLDGAVALVSGRTIAMLDGLFAPLRLRASGVHGAEYRFESGQVEPVVGPPPLPASLWADVRSVLEGFPGTFAENKAYSFAVHYRAVPSLRIPLQRAVEGLVAQHRDLPLRVMPGHCVFELKRTDFDKGTAVETFMGRAEFRGRRPVFIGDDVTDWPGLSAARRHGGWAFSVGTTAPDVDGTFPNPDAVRHWLNRLSRPETLSA